jgi:hypothetical protein
MIPDYAAISGIVFFCPALSGCFSPVLLRSILIQSCQSASANTMSQKLISGLVRLSPALFRWPAVEKISL